MIELFSSNTSNGQKVTLMLEETGLAYELRDVNLVAGEHLQPGFLDINPFGKIPAIIDHEGPDGKPLALAQSLAIVRYLAEKSGQFLPEGGSARALADQHMALVAADIGAAFSGIFMFRTMPSMMGQEPVAPAVSYFVAQAHRGLATLDGQLAKTPYLAGDAYSMADILAYPVATTSAMVLGPDPLADYGHLTRWVADIRQRPAVARTFA